MSWLRGVRRNKFWRNHLQISNGICVLEQVAHICLNLQYNFAPFIFNYILCIDWKPWVAFFAPKSDLGEWFERFLKSTKIRVRAKNLWIPQKPTCLKMESRCSFWKRTQMPVLFLFWYCNRTNRHIYKMYVLNGTITHLSYKGGKIQASLHLTCVNLSNIEQNSAYLSDSDFILSNKIPKLSVKWTLSV